MHLNFFLKIACAMGCSDLKKKKKKFKNEILIKIIRYNFRVWIGFIDNGA